MLVNGKAHNRFHNTIWSSGRLGAVPVNPCDSETPSIHVYDRLTPPPPPEASIHGMFKNGRHALTGARFVKPARARTGSEMMKDRRSARARPREHEGSGHPRAETTRAAFGDGLARKLPRAYEWHMIQKNESTRG